ncbi:MAG: endonuclease/exonuclease/phosphatase family protein [Planctomycetes bacterium]|nr:endonuclease/exonuclease/phosphatase family protein [Planctomycetota bacterium]
MKRRLKRLGAAGLGLMLIIVALAIGVPLWTSGPTIDSWQPASRVPAGGPSFAAEAQAVSSLKVMTLNLAHGRSDGAHQALLSRSAIRENLDRVAEMLRREQPAVVALQEADGPSIWSGRFDHVKYLAEAGRYSHHFRGEHVKGLRLSYGTALIAQMPLADTASQTFSPTPPTFSKGFVVGTLLWPGSETQVTVVSVHLGFARRSVRESQIRQMIDLLAGKRGPLIVMGDFNCQWTGSEETLRTLAAELNLRAYEPDQSQGATFPSTGKRLDWILISSDLQFVRYEVIAETLSDHRAVAAEIKRSDAK